MNDTLNVTTDTATSLLLHMPTVQNLAGNLDFRSCDLFRERLGLRCENLKYELSNLD